MYGHGNRPGANLDDILPDNVRATCQGESPGYSCTLLMQGFDWMSSKEPEHGWWRTLAAGIIHLHYQGMYTLTFRTASASRLLFIHQLLKRLLSSPINTHVHETTQSRRFLEPHDFSSCTIMVDGVCRIQWWRPSRMRSSKQVKCVASSTHQEALSSAR